MQTERAESFGELVRAYASCWVHPETPEDWVKPKRVQKTKAMLLGILAGIFAGAALMAPTAVLLGTESALAQAMAIAATIVAIKLVAWPVMDYVAGVPREVPA